MNRTIKDAGEEVTLEFCLMYYQIGFSCVWNDGKDLTLADKEKEPSDGRLKSSGNKNIEFPSIIP